MTGLFQDLRYAFRILHKNAGFTVVAVITLALGIGATTTIFSAVHAVLLAPLPYRDVDRLAMIWGSNPSRGDLQFPISAGDFSDWKQKNDIFEDIAASYDDEVTYSVVQRTHEIGLRMALGADRGDVLRLMVRQGTWIVLIGELIGLFAALVLARAASGLFYGVSPSDLWSIGGGMVLLMLVSVVASCLPAARAVRVDPVEALRYE